MTEAATMGLFVSFEGIEGSGKSTQINLLSDYLTKRHIPFIVTREPGGTPIGEKIRNIFLHRSTADIVPVTELLLVTAARVQHSAQVITPSLEQGKVVVCDRFFDATVAYQGYAEGIDLPVIFSTHHLFLKDLMPDVTFLMDCPVAIGLARSRKRNRDTGIDEAEGRFENKVLSFHEKVRTGYLSLAGKDPDRITVIEADKPETQIHERICRNIDKKLKGKGFVV